MRQVECSGFALTELLVAAGVLAVGLLGYLALLVEGLQIERDAINLASAATLAANAGERIRANPEGRLDYVLDPGAVPVADIASCAAIAPFDASTRAACDLAEWQQEVRNALPGAETSVTASAVAGTAALLYTIDIRWTARGVGPGGHFSLQLQV